MTPSEELGALDWETSMGDAARARHSVDGFGLGDKRASIEEEDEDEITADDDQDPSEGLARKEGYSTSKERLLAGIDAWTARFRVLFGPQWRRTTGLMIYIWMSMALAYGMSVSSLPAWVIRIEKQADGKGGSGVIGSMSGCRPYWSSVRVMPGRGCMMRFWNMSGKSKK